MVELLVKQLARCHVEYPAAAIRLIVEGERVSTWSLQAHRGLDRESAQASKTYRLRDCSSCKGELATIVDANAKLDVMTCIA